jgi:hypothetical protein
MIEVWRRDERDPWDLTVEAPGVGRARVGATFRPVRTACVQAPQRGTELAERRMVEDHPDAARCDRIPLPCVWHAGIEIPEDARVRMRVAGRSVTMPLRVELTDEVLWLLGLWVAEGSSHEKSNDAFLTIAGDDDEVLARASAIIERVFGLHVVHAAASSSSLGVDLHPLEAAAPADGLPRVRRRTASGSPAGSSGCR